MRVQSFFLTDLYATRSHHEISLRQVADIRDVFIEYASSIIFEKTMGVVSSIVRLVIDLFAALDAVLLE